MSPTFPSQRVTLVAFRETVWLALETLRAHKLRSFLTLLGVILSVWTLVAVISVINGLNRYVAERVANLGSNVFVVNQMGIITSFEELLKARKRPPIRMDDYELLRDHLTLARQVGANDDARADVRYGNDVVEDVLVLGVTGNFAEMRSIEAGNGRLLNDTDDQRRAPVAFIGADIAQRFFASVDPIGKSIRVGHQTYEIVGVGRALGSVFGQSQDNFVHIPMGAYMKSWCRSSCSIVIMVQSASTELMSAAEDEVRALLRAKRKVAYNDSDNFGIIAPTSITSLWERLTANIFAVAVGLTAVFLVVGGIVIMNIMLASVVERTREIGIRKSLGARRKHIVMQFLIESAVMSATGGLIGLLLALAAGGLVRAVTPIPVATPLFAVVLALGLSTSVGLFFGIYPAVRASRLDPIEALRFET